MSAFFDVLGTCTDSRLVTAITIMNNEYLAGTLTDVADLAEHAVTIYTNLKANKKWMILDPKEAQIIALTTKVESHSGSRFSGHGMIRTTDGNGFGNWHIASQKLTVPWRF